MLVEKNLKVFGPCDCASRNAVSAFASRASASALSWGKIEIPTLAVTETCRPPTSNGFVEWENLGLRRNNADAEAYMLFAMWDPGSGEFRANPFRVNIQKLDTQHNPPYVRLRFISDGDERNTGYNFLDWDPAQRYRWRVEWGPSTDRNEARVYVNDVEVMQVVYTPPYEPRTHWVELGVNESRNESCVGAVFSNVRIGRR